MPVKVKFTYKPLLLLLLLLLQEFNWTKATMNSGVWEHIFCCAFASESRAISLYKHWHHCYQINTVSRRKWHFTDWQQPYTWRR